MNSVPVAIVGAGGYTGQELVRLALAHPGYELVGLFGSGRTGADVALDDVAPALRETTDISILPADAASIGATGARVVFLATPHEASATLAGELRELAPGLTIVDLSGAFRFKDASAYPTHYGFEHPHPGLLAEAVYGLPELTRDRLDGAELIACAGCYVTAASVPLAALSRACLLAADRPIIDAMSGVSGAGRKTQTHTSFCEVSATPYGVFTHRHRPEIEQAVGTPVVFQPMLGPWSRGILATIHVKLAGGVGLRAVTAALEGAYAEEPFIRLLGSDGVMPSVVAVERTNFVDIAWAVEESDEGTHLVIFSALDNLMKGASGQALQCANIALGLDETAGLSPVARKTVTL